MSHSKKSETDVGSTVDATTVLELLDKVTAALALPTQTLTAKQRKAATRTRKGMEKVIPTLATLSTEHGVSVPKQLDPVQSKLTALLTLVQDTMDSAGSSSFNTASTLYGMLQKVAHRDSQLKSQLAPVKEFFAYRTPAAKKAHPKQRGKKAALAAEKLAAAQATAGASVSATPTTPPAATASTSAPVAPSNVVTPHAP